jgi:hypothetical protein
MNGVGCRQGTASNAAVKVEVYLDMLSGHLVGPLLEAGRVPERDSALQHQARPAGALRVTDLGYWGLDHLETLTDQAVFGLLRTHPQVHFCERNGLAWDLLALAWRPAKADRPVCSVSADRLLWRRAAATQRERRTPSQRLLALAEWSSFVTNLAPTQLSLEEALVMARRRWQIERRFKRWKNHGQLDTFHTENPWRILGEFYAKLIAMMIQHWRLLPCGWAFPDRSLPKAANPLCQHALSLLMALADPTALVHSITTLQPCLQQSCSINKSRKTLRNFQLLLQFAESPASLDPHGPRYGVPLQLSDFYLLAYIFSKSVSLTSVITRYDSA